MKHSVTNTNKLFSAPYYKIHPTTSPQNKNCSENVLTTIIIIIIGNDDGEDVLTIIITNVRR